MNDGRRMGKDEEQGKTDGGRTKEYGQRRKERGWWTENRQRQRAGKDGRRAKKKDKE